jgi:L-threonylcarbamoyladenylate synthase
MTIKKNEITEEILGKIRNGAVFISPTDTIYGLSCDARNGESVSRLRKLKGRDDKPLSIWVPSKQWIQDNCDASNLDKLPGPYTLILPLLTASVASEVNPGLNTIGVRIPDHWFSKIVEKLGFPLVTTSVNKVGKEHMTSLENGDKEILDAVDFVIYEGEKSGEPSTIIKEKKEIER